MEMHDHYDWRLKIVDGDSGLITMSILEDCCDQCCVIRVSLSTSLSSDLGEFELYSVLETRGWLLVRLNVVWDTGSRGQANSSMINDWAEMDRRQ